MGGRCLWWFSEGECDEADGAEARDDDADGDDAGGGTSRFKAEAEVEAEKEAGLVACVAKLPSGVLEREAPRDGLTGFEGVLLLPA